jgi:autotransporter adhesin
MSSVTRAVVRCTKLVGWSVAEGLARVDAICAAGAQCPEVLGSPVAAAALAELQAAVAAAHVAFAAVVAAILASRAATKALAGAFGRADTSLRVYEQAVRGIAGGDAAIIAGAGLLARNTRTPSAALGNVTAVEGKQGRREVEVILSWPAVEGATGYVIELSFTPGSLDGPWTAIPIGSRLRRVITAPAPGAQVLARVVAVDRHGNQSDWSSPILVTAR